MADLFFQSKSASDRANEATLAALAKDVRADLGHVTAAHDGLYRQFQAQATLIAELEIELRRARTATEGQLVRTAYMEKQLTVLGFWIKGAVALLVVSIGLLFTLLHRL